VERMRRGCGEDAESEFDERKKEREGPQGRELLITSVQPTTKRFIRAS